MICKNNYTVGCSSFFNRNVYPENGYKRYKEIMRENIHDVVYFSEILRSRKIFYMPYIFIAR